MNITKDKITLYTIFALISILITQNVQTYFLQQKINKLYDVQIEELDRIKAQNKTKIDSIQTLKDTKQTRVNKKEKALYNSINLAKKNNKRYEKLKKNAANSTSADSLQRILTNRYQ